MKKIIIMVAICIIALLLIFTLVGKNSISETTEVEAENATEYPESSTGNTNSEKAIETGEINESGSENVEESATETAEAGDARTVVVTSTDGEQTTITIRSGEKSTKSESASDTDSKTSQTDKSSEGSSDKDTVSSGEQSSVSGLSYEEYCALSSKEQRAYYETFESDDAFFEWYNAAKEAYEKAHPAIEIKDGDIIDFGGGN